MVSWDFESNDGMSGGTPCRIQLCVPKPRGSLQTCVNFDILWFFLKFSYSIPIKKPKVWDLVIWWFAWLLHCKAKLLRFGTSQENWWFGTWNLEKLRRSWVNFGVDTWHLTLWMHFGWWSAQGNHIPYHGNGSDLTGLTAIFNSRVWKLWTTVSEKLRSVGQDDICNTYECKHIVSWYDTYCMTYNIVSLTVPFLN